MKIWIGAGGEPSSAEEYSGLDLFQPENIMIILLSREQSLRADSLPLCKSEKVLPDMPGGAGSGHLESRPVVCTKFIQVCYGMYWYVPCCGTVPI